MTPNTVYCGDCLDFLRSMPTNSFDLVFCSPPYEDARTYGIDFSLSGQEWVDWCVERYLECVRVCRGLVAWVVEGRTRKFQYTASPVLLMADLHRAGVKLRKPPVFHRVGVPGSGGPDWLRNDYEFIVCSSKGKLPWSDNTAMGHPPKWAPGGEMSYRISDGTRRNQWGSASSGKSTRARDKHGVMSPARPKPSHVTVTKRSFAEKVAAGAKVHTKNDGDGMREQACLPPVKANPGNVIRCVVGGGVMGDRLCHENEAPFPEDLAEFFVRSFCPAGGLVLDPFCGSGTTAAVAFRLNRKYVTIDVRQSQVDLARQRIAKVNRELL